MACVRFFKASPAPSCVCVCVCICPLNWMFFSLHLLVCSCFCLFVCLDTCCECFLQWQQSFICDYISVALHFFLIQAQLLHVMWGRAERLAHAHRTLNISIRGGDLWQKCVSPRILLVSVCYWPRLILPHTFSFLTLPFFLSYLISMTDGTLIHSSLAFAVRDITVC